MKLIFKYLEHSHGLEATLGTGNKQDREVAMYKKD